MQGCSPRVSGADAHAALRCSWRQMQRACQSQRHLQHVSRQAPLHRRVRPRCRCDCRSSSSGVCAPHTLFAVSGSFVHAHAVIVHTVRFAAFIAVSPVTPGTGIDNSQSGVLQLRDCQCTSSLRYGCFIVGCAVIDCRCSFSSSSLSFHFSTQFIQLSISNLLLSRSH